MASKGTASTFLETKRDSFPQPIQVTEEDDDERNTRLETLAEEEEEEALKDLKFGYTQSAMLHREKAAKCRAAMSKGYTLGNMLRKSVLKE